MAYIMNSANPIATPQLEAVQRATQKLGLQLMRFDVRDPDDLDATLLSIARSKANTLLIGGDAYIYSNMAKVAQAVRKAKLPALSPYADSSSNGVLIMEWTLPTRYGIGCAKVEVQFYHLRERERQDEHYSSWHRFGKDGVPGAWSGRAGQDGATQAT